MGCAFNYVVVPDSVKKVGDLRRFYGEYRDGLLMDYGEEFEGYSGDMAVDDGSLVVRRDLKLDYDGGFDDLSGIFDDLMNLCKKAGAIKWGPSVSFRVGGRWVICGFYSD